MTAVENLRHLIDTEGKDGKAFQETPVGVVMNALVDALLDLDRRVTAIEEATDGS